MLQSETHSEGVARVRRPATPLFFAITSTNISCTCAVCQAPFRAADDGEADPAHLRLRAADRTAGKALSAREGQRG